MHHLKGLLGQTLSIALDEEGRVKTYLHYGDLTEPAIDQIDRVDIEEWKTWLSSHGVSPDELVVEHVNLVGWWNKDGTYREAIAKARESFTQAVARNRLAS
jgi:hypothetical protein